MRSRDLLCIAFWVPAVIGVSPAVAQTRTVVRAADVMEWPRDYDFGVVCDARYGFRKDPDFGDGLVARYTLVANPDYDFTTANLNLPGVRYVRKSAHARTMVVHDDNVIRDHDALVAEFQNICSSAMGWNARVADLRYTRASAAQQRASPVVPRPEGTLPPVRIALSEADFLPQPVANGGITFTDGQVIYGGPNWLPITPDFGSGLGSMYLFEGAQEPHYLSTYVATLDAKGFTVVVIDLDGKSQTLVIDRQVITTRSQMQARALLVRELEYGRTLKLDRIVYYPDADPGIDDLRLPAARKTALHGQFAAAIAAYQQDLLDVAQRMPEGYEIDALFKAGWVTTPEALGFDQYFGADSSTYGELYKANCTRKALIFTCTVAATYLQQGRPKYAEQDLQFTRVNGELERYEEEIILIN